MPAVKYVVRLTDEERSQIDQVIHSGTWAARKLTRARILAKADQGWSDGEVAEALDTGITTVWRTRRRFVEEGLEGALNERPRLGQRRKLEGKQEAHLIAVACSKAPAGHTRWTLRLLASQVVELGFAESYSYESVRRVLKKTTSSPGRRSSGASPK